MNVVPLRRLIRHTYSDGAYSYHYAPADGNRDDEAANIDDTTPAHDRADIFTDWPPQPMTAWLNEPKDQSTAMFIPLEE